MKPKTDARAGEMTVEELVALEGEEVGVSSWLPVTQEMIDGFAHLTDDHQYIHVDPARAAETPFGGTIAHGFLTLSLLAPLAYEVRPRPKGATMSVNYGFDRLRFVAPVPAGARIRARFRLDRLERDKPGQVTMCWGVTMEVEGEDRPALVADWITRAYLENA